MLECPKCGHDNDLGRIFCVKCGEKLDISHVVAPGGAVRRARKGGKTIPWGRRISFFFSKVFRVILLAAVSAFLTLVWAPPRFQHEGFTETNFAAFQEKRSQWEQAISNSESYQLVFDEGDLNAGMASAVKNAQKGSEESKGPILESVYIQLCDGSVLVTVQNKWKWFRLTAQIKARIEQKDGKWQCIPEAAWVGRCRLPPQAVPKVSEQFAALWKDLNAERQWLETAGSVQVKPGKLMISTAKTKDG